MTFVKGDIELEFCDRNWTEKCIVCGRSVTFGSEAITYHEKDQVTIVLHGRCADVLLRALMQDRLKSIHYAGAEAAQMKMLAFQLARKMEADAEVRSCTFVPEVTILGTNTEC